MAVQGNQAGGGAVRHRHCYRLALAGSAVWLVWLITGDVPSVDALVVLSPLVLHPLVMRLVAWDEARPHWLFWIATYGQLPAAVLLVLSFGWERGPGAAALAAPWTAIAGVTALYGLQRIIRDGLRPVAALATNAGLVFVAIGGMWTLASRYGMRPFAFSDTIVLLTGAHFHYAGFVLPVLAGLTARANGKPIFDAVALGVIAAVPLTAIGITYSPHVELFAASLLVASGFGLAIGQLIVARAATKTLASLLLGLSSLSLMFAMTLAMLYATSEFRGLPWPPIPDMARWHGTLNALGTCLLGVWAWTLEGPSDPK